MSITSKQTLKGAMAGNNTLSGRVAVTASAGTAKAVLYSSQTLTEEQKEQARNNIDAQPKGDYVLKEELPSVPTHLSQLEQDADHRLITDAEKAAWNAKSDFSGKYADLEGKPDIPTVPENVSAFENDVGYLTEHQDLSQYAKKSDIPDTSAFITRAVNDLANYYRKSETYTQDEIDNRISTIPKFSISVVSFLPTQDISDTTIYLVSGDNDVDLYTEYIHVNGAWETLGSQRVDLTDYATQTWTLEQLAGYQPKGEYLTKVPDEYVTEADIDAKGYLTEHQDLSDYALKEEIPQIDDAVVSAESTWSSKNTVERFLPEFSKSGSVVECHPFPLCPLNVSTMFEPAQAGGGRNLFNPDYFAEQAPAIQRHKNGIVFTTTPSSISFFLRVELALKPNTTYSISGVMSNSLSAPDVNELLLSNTKNSGDRKRTVTTADDGVVNVYIYVNYANTDVIGQQISAYYTDVMLVEGTAAVDYAPYSNIRPISGYDKLSLTRCGKNLFDVSNAANNTNLFDSVSSDGAITVKGSNPKIWTTSYFGKFRMLAGTTYTISGVLGYGRVGFSTNPMKIPSDSSYPDISVKRSGAADLLRKTISTNIFTANETCDVYVWYCADSDNNGSDAAFTMSVQIELGSIATPYEPYQGDTYSVHLGDTVYGGTYDWSKGELAAEWKMLPLDGTEGWSVNLSNQNGSPNRFHLTLTGYEAGNHQVIADRYKTVKWSAHGSNVNSVVLYRDAAWEYTRLSIASDLNEAEFKAYLAEQYAAGTPVQVAYKLATPITIQLAPQIKTLQGGNTLYGDGLLSVYTNGHTYSGEVIQFDSRVEGNKVDAISTLEPKQEGSGDPYPAGGGKNLLLNTAGSGTANGITFTLNADGSVTADGTATANAYYDINKALSLPAGQYALSGCPSSSNGVNYLVYAQSAKGDKYDSGKGVNFDAAADETWYVRIKIASGITVSNLTFRPMIRKATETDATYAPYSNIRPISGYDKLGLTRCGKNLARPFKDTTKNGLTLTNNPDGSVTLDGTATASFPIDSERFFLPAGTYTISIDKPKKYLYVSYDNENDLMLGKSDDLYKMTGRNDSDFGTMHLWIEKGHTFDNFTFKLQLESGSTATPYEPYRSDTYTVHLGDTVYGGTYDWSNGELVAEWAMKAFDGTETALCTHDDWADGAFEVYAFFNDAVSVDGYLTKANIVCSHLPVVTPADISNGKVDVGVGKGQKDVLYMRIDKKYNTVDLIKAYLAAQYAAGTPVQIAYKLATPITIQLAPPEIMPIDGANVLLSNPDDTTVSGKLDPIYLHEQNKAAVAKLADMETRLRALESAAVNNA